jgi:hypothetical protein
MTLHVIAGEAGLMLDSAVSVQEGRQPSKALPSI